MSLELTVLFQPAQQEALYRSVASMPRASEERTKQSVPETQQERRQRHVIGTEPPFARCSSATWRFESEEDCQTAVESLAYAGGDLLFSVINQDTQRGELGVCLASTVASVPWDYKLQGFICHMNVVDCRPIPAANPIVDVLSRRIEILRRWHTEQAE